jgi:ferredoxin-NAD(P)+ reductase (naphthalene dioxygenase ferredoxin-specific)
MRNAIHVYFGVRSPADIYGAQWLADLAEEHANLKVHIVVAMGNHDSQLRSGLVTDAVVNDWKDLSGWRAYLCGAPPMVEAAAMLVKQRGIQPEHVYADAFYPSAT